MAMLSNVDGDCVETHSELYCELLRLLSRQVTSIEEDFFEVRINDFLLLFFNFINGKFIYEVLFSFYQDIEMSGDNFLIPALKKLCNTTGQIYDNEMQTARTHLCKILENRFSETFHSMDGNARGPAPGTSMQIDDDDDDGDDDSMPVVVSNEEVAASSARSSQSPSKSSSVAPNIEHFSSSIRRKYPVLFAAKLDHEVR